MNNHIFPTTLFVTTFIGLFYPMLKLALIASASGFALRKKILSQHDINSLSAVTVKILLPCLTISITIRQFKPDELPIWGLIVLSGMAIMLITIGFSALVFWKELPGKKNLIALASMQNGLFLVLPIGRVYYQDRFEVFALYCFLFVLGQGAIIWSLGKYLIVTTDKVELNYRDFISPPVVASLLAIGMVLLKLHFYLPSIVIEALGFLGEAAIPISILILGATLGSVQFSKLPSTGDFIKVLNIKFIFVPLLSLFILMIMRKYISDTMLNDMTMIESASAPATALLLMARSYEGDYQQIGKFMLVAYVICILAMPFWLAVWQVIEF